MPLTLFEFTRLATATLVAAAISIACSGTDSSDATPRPDASNDPSPVPTVPPRPADGGADAGDADHADAAADAAPATKNEGEINVSSITYSGTNPGGSSAIGGDFRRTPIGAFAPCAPSTVGTCAVRTCDFTNGGTPNVQLTTPGTVKVTGVLPSQYWKNGVAEFQPNTMQHSSVSWDKPFWNGGEAITVSASGTAGGAPAFTFTTAAPFAVTITSPTLSAASPLSVTSGEPLAIAWQGGQDGDVVVSLDAWKSQKGVTARCSFPANASNGEVPAVVMDLLLATSTKTNRISVFTEKRARLTPPDWTMGIALRSGALAEHGGSAEGYFESP